MNRNFPKSIISDPAICHGQPVFANTRVMVWQVLELLEAGQSAEEILSAYPHLPQSAVKDALMYAAQKVRGIAYIPFANKTLTTNGQLLA